MPPRRKSVAQITHSKPLPPPTPEEIEAAVRGEAFAASLFPKAKDRGLDVQFSSTPVEQARNGYMRLPGFQRPAVWSPEMALGYVRGVLCERKFPGLFIARARYTDGGRDVLDILDGQQRLLALGGVLQRGSVADVAAMRGERIVGAAPHLNLLARSADDVLVARGADEQPPPVFGDPEEDALDCSRIPVACMRRVAYFTHRRVAEYVCENTGCSREQGFSVSAWAYAACGNIYLPFLIVYQSASVQDVKDMFRSINTPGVRITEAELEALLSEDD
jgi:hypothetical protein